MDTCTLLSPWNYHNIVNWLYPKYKSLKKKKAKCFKTSEMSRTDMNMLHQVYRGCAGARGHDWNTRGAWNQETQALLCDEVCRVTILQTIKKSKLLTQKLFRGNALWNLLGKVPGTLNDFLHNHTLGAPAWSPNRGAAATSPRSATYGVSLWASSCLWTSAVLPVRWRVPHAYLGAVLGTGSHVWECVVWALRDRPLANLSSRLHLLFQNEFQETLLLPR